MKFNKIVFDPSIPKFWVLLELHKLSYFKSADYNKSDNHFESVDQVKSANTNKNRSADIKIVLEISKFNKKVYS